MFKLVYN
jgi:hypothetical protein